MSHLESVANFCRYTVITIIIKNEPGLEETAGIRDERHVTETCLNSGSKT